MAIMYPAGLQAHEPMLQQCVERLVARLARSADSGEPVDMASTLSDMTMEAIGFAAFGVNLHCQDITDTRSMDISGNDWLTKPGTPEFGRGLTNGARAVFRSGNPAGASKWYLPVSDPMLYCVTSPPCLRASMMLMCHVHSGAISMRHIICTLCC